MKYGLFCFFTLLLTVSACSHNEVYQPAPVGVSISGVWLFEGQNNQSFKRLLNALNYVPMEPMERRIRENQINNSSNMQYSEEKMLRDLLVGLLTIIPKEIYIEQSEEQVAIDFGVAGYHTFNIGKKTEILMDGIEIDAYAGWKQNDFVIRLGMSNYYQLTEKFTLLGQQKFVETIELKISGRDKPLVHKRYFKLATDKTTN